METKSKKNIINEGIEKGILFPKKVKIVPVPRDGGMITEKNHIGYFRYDGTKINWVLPKSRTTRNLVQILTPAEKEFFEEALDIDLNIYKKKDNYWNTFRVEIEKNDTFMAYGHVLDLQDPHQNLQWRLWKTAPFVAPSWEERLEKGDYFLAIVDEDYQEVQRATKSTKNIKAYKHLGKIEGSRIKLYDFLCIYNLQNPKARKPDAEATTEALVAMAQELVENDINGYLTIAEDPNYEMKLLIHRAIGIGAIDKKYTSKDYFTPEGKFIGNNIDQVIHNLLQPEWQEDYIRIKGQVNATLKKSKDKEE